MLRTFGVAPLEAIFHPILAISVGRGPGMMSQMNFLSNLGNLLNVGLAIKASKNSRFISNRQHSSKILRVKSVLSWIGTRNL